MRLLPVAMGALLSLAFVGIGGATSSPNNCESAGDASTNQAGATAITLPTRCSGEIPANDAGDTFAFTVVAGQPLHVVIDAPDGWVDYALATPSDAAGDWHWSFVGGDHNVFVNDSPEGGTWYLGLGAGAGHPHYTLEIDQNSTTYSGHVIVGLPDAPPVYSSPVRVNRALGPGSPTIDGAWIDLGWTASGNETSHLYYSDAAVSHADLAYYDAAGVEIGSCPGFGLFTNGVGEVDCGIPDGTTKILVQASNTVAMDYTLVVYH